MEIWTAASFLGAAGRDVVIRGGRSLRLPSDGQQTATPAPGGPNPHDRPPRETLPSEEEWGASNPTDPDEFLRGWGVA